MINQISYIKKTTEFKAFTKYYVIQICAVLYTDLGYTLSDWDWFVISIRYKDDAKMQLY